LFTLVFDDPTVVALVPLVIDDTDAGVRVRFCGGDDLTDYLGPLLSPSADQAAVAEALLAQISKLAPEWDYFDAKCMPVPFGFSEWLVEAADRLGMPFSVTLSDLTAVLPLPDTFDAYLEVLAPKKRHELRRKLRRFEREADGAHLRRAGVETLGEDIDKFVSLHRGSEGLKGKFMVPERASFFESAAQAFGPSGILSLDFLEADGAVMASTFSFKYQGVFYLYNSAYDHSLKSLSPGLVLVVQLIERSIQEGITRFDFLRGRERYKFDLGAEPLPLHTVQIRR